jgi:hypothetical protein
MKTKFKALFNGIKNWKFILFIVTLWQKLSKAIVKAWHKFSVRRLIIKKISVYTDESKYSKILIDDYEPKMAQPFIIRVENTSSEPVKDVELLNAIRRFKLSGLSDSYPGLKISYSIPQISYEDFLTNLLSYKYVINQIRLSAWSKTEKINMQDLGMIIQQFQINGNSESWPVIPNIDKEQYAQTIYDYNKEFKLDCFTSLKFVNIPPFVSFNVYLYPKVRY